MWSLGVVVGDPGADDVIGLFGAEAHDVVQDFLFQASDYGFAICVGLGGLEGRSNVSDTFAFPELPESNRKLRVPIVHKVLRLYSEFIEPVNRISRLLNYCASQIFVRIGIIELTASSTWNQNGVSSLQFAGNQPIEISCSEAGEAPINRAFRVRLSFLTIREANAHNGGCENVAQRFSSYFSV